VFDRGLRRHARRWKVATDRRAKCEIAVPASWMPGALSVGMKAPQGDVSVIVSSSPLPTLADAKKMTNTMYKPTNSFEDTASRYWIAYAPSRGRTGTFWYEAIAANGMVCAVQIEADSSLSESDARQIAASLKTH
jgi:hypothetical protein